LSLWRNNRKGLKWEDQDGNILVGAVDNILQKEGRLIVLDYKTRGYPTKEDTHLHYQHQLNVYAFLLQKNGYQIEDYGFLLFYVPSKVLETGEILFDTELVKMAVNPKDAEKLFKEAIGCLNGDCPQTRCVWCERV
jgi:RecB family exonuclease